MQSHTCTVIRAGLKGRGARGNFYWRALRTSFMMSSFVKVMFSLIRKVPVCFFPVVENVLTQMHIQLAARREFMM